MGRIQRLQLAADHRRESQHGDGHVGLCRGELGDGPLGLDDVLLDRRLRRPPADHLLGEERGIVVLAAVHVSRGFEDHLADRRLRARARGQDPLRAEHVDLVRSAERRGQRVGDQSRVDDRVDAGRPHDPPQQSVIGVDADELGPLERVLGVGGVDPDDRLELWIGLEQLGQPSAPMAREVRDQDPLERGGVRFSGAACGVHPSHTLRRWATSSSRFSWIRARISSWSWST